MDLIQVLLGRINRELHRNVTHISKDALESMEQYDWPGNIRELENVLMKSIALSRGNTLSRDLLPAPLNAAVENSSTGNSQESDRPLEQQSLEEMEGAHIARVLEATAWHKGHACEILGTSRPRLRRMIQHYDLKPPVEMEDNEDDFEQTTVSQE